MDKLDIFQAIFGKIGKTSGGICRELKLALARSLPPSSFSKVFMWVVPAPDGTLYLVDINGTRYWGSI